MTFAYLVSIPSMQLLLNASLSPWQQTNLVSIALMLDACFDHVFGATGSMGFVRDARLHLVDDVVDLGVMRHKVEQHLRVWET